VLAYFMLWDKLWNAFGARMSLAAPKKPSGLAWLVEGENHDDTTGTTFFTSYTSCRCGKFFENGQHGTNTESSTAPRNSNFLTAQDKLPDE